MERKRMTIPILGLNRSEPDLQVKDGSCSQLHNLRYDAGAWRNVNVFKSLKDVRDFDGYTIIYKHPATGPDLYIASDNDEVIHEVKLSDGVFSSTQRIHTATERLQTIFTFGNVLTIVDNNTEYYYVLYGSGYVLFNIPEPPKIKHNQTRKIAFSSEYYYSNNGSTQSLMSASEFDRYDRDPPLIATPLSAYITLLANFDTEEVLLKDHFDGYWSGGIAVMVAYKMKDGEVVSNSELMLFTSEEMKQQDVENLAYINKLKFKPLPTQSSPTYLYMEKRTRREVESNNYYCCPNITLTINADIDTRLINSVVVYSTRLNPLYDYAMVFKNDGEWKPDDQRHIVFKDIYDKDNDICNQPLYALKEIPIKDFTEAQFSFDITYGLLSEITTNQLFEPTQSLHSISAECYYEYNSRLHKANTRTRFFSGYSDFCEYNLSPITAPGGALYNTCLVSTINIDGRRYNTVKHLSGDIAISVGRVLSYPDYRAERLGIMREDARAPVADTLSGTWQLSADLKPCLANNYAWAVCPSTDNVKYPVFTLDGAEHEPTTPSDIFTEPNRIQVSAESNMFALPFSNSYRVGSLDDHIKAFATVADELSSTRFGAFPLFVFTDSGIWSLESGSGEVLYSNVVPVNHDRITNNHCCAAQNAVFYITSRGVHAMQGRHAKLISEPMHDRQGEFIDYIQNAEFHFQFKFGDLIIYNKAHNFAYIYSTATGVWFSRDIRGRVLNNDEVVTTRNIGCIDDEQEDGPVECFITTRPIKLGSTEFKRLETIIARLSSADSFIHLNVECSNDCNTWITLRDEWCNTRDVDMRLRRTPMSAKYFRLKIHLTANCQVDISGADIEFYNRFAERLR